MKKTIGSIFIIACMVLPLSVNADPIFSQGFETDTDGWFDKDDSWSGNVERQLSGTSGITAFEGNYYAQFTQTNDTGGLTAAFSRLGGYNDVFPGDYSLQTAIYLDTSWANGSGFDFSVASNDTSGNHLQDFIFHVTKDTSTGELLVGGSNNTNFDPREDLESLNSFSIADSGWYVFEHLFRDDNGVLAVDLNLKNVLGDILFTETRTTATNLIPSEVGGNRYAWFTNIDIAEGIAVDGISLSVVAQEVSEPSIFAIFCLGVSGLVLRRKYTQ
ncbi:hypothetical protein [uncultured Paraglaciecola sp.]|uniref:hypothetical protein n=1 Tax=uncultured Paraglaciecola sp. TaxID=1765024 RepID=UPI0030DBB2FC|tara:strand:- start:40384 stop:41202 length:819 start_codon:yes stop_codon:yes gene_type:complete